MQFSHCQEMIIKEIQARGLDDGQWFKPAQIGGYANSRHSPILMQLVRMGLVQWDYQYGAGGVPGKRRGGRLYRVIRPLEPR